MTEYLLLAVVAVGILIGLVRWRLGLVFFFLAGTLQDPIRKMLPDVPSYIVLSSVPILLAMLVGLVKSGSGSWVVFRRQFPGVGRTVGTFFLCLLPPAYLSATYGPGSWMFTIVGLLSVFILFAGILVGYFYVKDPRDVERALTFFCLFTAVMSVGAYLEYFNLGLESGLIGDYRLGHTWIRQTPGVEIRMIAGLYRSPDVMGWHAALLVMCGLTLWLYRKNPWWLLPALAGFVALLLCGRRKMVYLVPIYIITVTLLSRYFKQLRGATYIGFLSLAIAIFGMYAYRSAGLPQEHIDYYTNDPMDAISQLERHGFQSLITTYEQSGFFGEGLGFAATGAHNISASRPRIWQESGVSKVMVELGVPGFIAFVIFQLSLLWAGWRALKRPIVRRTPAFFLYVSLFAIVVGNYSQFLVSGQIYGDPFIASLLSIMIGAMLSSARILKDEPLPGRRAIPKLRRR